MRLVFDEKALADLDVIRQWISAESPKSADAVIERLLAECLTLIVFPKMGRVGKEPGTRELAVIEYPYLIVYRLAGDDVVIVGIPHTSLGRDPEPA